LNESFRQKAFLDVDQSASGRMWADRLDARGRNAALAMTQATGLPELVARVLAGRGIGADEAEAFLAPAIRDLMPDPLTMTGMKEAADRIARAIISGEKTVIFGDYDVDGAASSALLCRYLRHHGLDPEIYIPDRVFEGYGPNTEAMRQLAEAGAQLIVTVDCGAASFEALAEAEKLGVDVVVLDHHQMGEAVPPAVAVVNPNRQDDLSGLGHLCAAGVVFMTAVAVTRLLRERGWYGAVKAPDLLQWLDLVALATVCDVVPLVGLNRAFVVKGLAAMRALANPGIAALAAIARVSGPLEANHLGFIIGPRINAGGRIGDAALGSRLLCEDDRAQAEVLAAQLDRLNAERQAAEKRMLEEALAQAEAEMAGGDGPPIMMVQSDNWHPGIVGLIAARLKERFARPAIAIQFDGLGRGSGSGRSISGVDLGHAVRSALEQGILVKGGGHAMAAGLTVERGRLADLRSFLEEAVGADVANALQRDNLRIDGALSARGATLELVELLERAGPYGAGHPQPIFAFPAHAIRNPRVVGQNHVSVSLSAGDGASLKAIAFRAADREFGQLLLAPPPRLHVAGTLSADFWQGSRRVQLRITDAAVPQG